MSFHRTRERRFPQTEEVCPDDKADPKRFFGEAHRTQKGNWKVLQLCKQVERAAAVTLASECDSDALLGAAVVSVEPAPDAARLRVTVILPSGKGAEHRAEAEKALRNATAAFREEVARSVHRKRVPEIVFEVMLAEEVAHG